MSIFPSAPTCHAARRIDGELAGANLAVLSQSGHAARCVDRSWLTDTFPSVPSPAFLARAAATAPLVSSLSLFSVGTVSNLP